MKSNYDKYMQEVWDMKDKAYEDFKKSSYACYADYVKNEVADLKIKYRKQRQADSADIHS
jgi:hypothetical protein